MLPKISEKNEPTQTVEAALKRVGNYMNHTMAMLASLRAQNGVTLTPGSQTATKVQAVYDETRTKLTEIREKLNKDVRQNKLETDTLTKREIKNIHHLLKSVQKNIAKVLSQAQVDALVEASGSDEKSVRNKVATLSQGGLSAGLIRLLACIPFINTCFHRAVNAYAVGMNFMDQASKQAVNVPATKLEQDRAQEFQAFVAGKSQLERRTGVIGMNGIYRIKAAFSQKTMSKQLDSFIAQNLGNQPRMTISKEVKFKNNEKEFSLTSQLVPLNNAFDAHLKSTQRVFDNIFGNKGISAANRQEPHLINGWMSMLKNKKDQPIFRAFRHGILADKFEKNQKIRDTHAKHAAQELLLAAMMQEMADRKISFEQAAKDGIDINLNSVSLVTPDWVRSIGTGGANEKTMLADQIRALKSFEGKGQSLTIQTENGEVKIPVRVNVNTFNFGVNAGAVGKLSFAPGLKFGLATQYEENKKAFAGLEKQFQRLQTKTTVRINDPNAREALYKKLGEARSLMSDIKLLMENKKAYLDGDNQYEIGAKIMILTNQMDVIFKHTKNAGVHTSFNCMSGKDRTGIMDAVVKSFVAYANTHEGHYPTHEELKTKKVQDELREILIPFLLESGNLEITELNTGAKGYKVESEARLLGMPLDVFLNVQGLSGTTSA